MLALRALRAVVALKVFAIVVALDPEGLVPFDLPKALASRAFEWLVAALLLLAFASYGRALLPRTRLHLAVLAVVAAYAIATPFAANPYVALFGEQERYLGLASLVDLALLYLACAVAVREERDARIVFGAIGAGAAVAFAYATLQRLGVDPFAWQDTGVARPFGTFGNADQLGHFLSLVFGLALGAAVAARSARSRILGAAAALATLALAGVVATRGTLVGVAGALAGAPFTGLATRRRLAAGAAALALTGAAILVASPLGERVRETLLGQQIADRLTLYEAAARAFASRPLTGYGPDNFRAAFAAERTAASVALIGAGPQTSAHDWLLDAAASAGAPGAIALALLVVSGTVALGRLARRSPASGAPLFLGWCAYWAHAFVAVESITVAWYPWLALGLAAGVGAPRSGPARPMRRVPRWAAALVLLLALAGAATGARAFLANRDAWTSEDARRSGDAADAVTYADRAAARDPGRADYWNLLGLALDAARRDGSVDAYREATRREPHEVVLWANLARSLARAALASGGSGDDAIAAATEATRVDPNAPVGHAVLAEVAIAFHRCDLAREEAARAKALDPMSRDDVTRAAACR